MYVCAKSLQSIPTIFHSMDWSPPGSSVHGIVQARLLERVALPSSRGIFPIQGSNHVSYVSCVGRWVLYHSYHLGSPFLWLFLFRHTHVWLQSHGLQHARPPHPSPTPGVCPNSCPLSRWCHPTISSSVIPFSSCLQSFPVLESFLMSQLSTSGGQSIGAFLG